VIEIFAAWEPGAAAVQRNWAHSLFEALQVNALPGGYPNLIGPAQRSQAHAAYGPNAGRLIAVKQSWDGGNTFAATSPPIRQ
jgi:hypothetical protein